MITVVLAIASMVLVLTSVAFFAWKYFDYIIMIWDNLRSAFFQIFAGIPDFFVPVIGAMICGLAIAILLKLL